MPGGMGAAGLTRRRVLCLHHTSNALRSLQGGRMLRRFGLWKRPCQLRFAGILWMAKRNVEITLPSPGGDFALRTGSRPDPAGGRFFDRDCFSFSIFPAS